MCVCVGDEVMNTTQSVPCTVCTLSVLVCVCVCVGDEVMNTTRSVLVYCLYTECLGVCVCV